jgi:4-amino-4-deoxy-L-arabinose transferase-like glycosyltransferase
MSVKSSISNVATNTPVARTRRLRGSQAAFWVAWTVVLGAKFLLATHLAPFGDEAWYWQESRQLDWGYSDLPPATAWLIALGEALCGHGTLGMRVPFLLLGALLPLMLVRLGNRCFGAHAGWQAGLLALVFPLTMTLGLFALPDVPLTVASLLALDAFESAARRDRTRDWILLGLALAAAWLCHYRAAMLFAAGLAFLSLTPRGRTLWRRPGLWLAFGLGLLGVLPTLIFNATHDWVAFRFQVLDRNPWQFHADALVQPLEQALVCTPLFYVLLLWAAWRSARRRR